MEGKGDKNSGKNLSQEINVPVPWGTMAAVCWGDPRSQPVLVVHGIQDNAGSFDRLIPFLPDGFYYVCMELPGHGKSSCLPEGVVLDFMMYLSTIYRFVRHLSWTRFYYLGHSFGGQLGMYYSAMYPEQVIKLIAIDTVPFFAFTLDEFLKYHKNLSTKLVDLEQKMTQSSPPNYTLEQAIDRLMKNRSTPITREAAEALVKRMVKKTEKNGYYFSTDQRLKHGVKSFLIIEQNLHCLSKIQCPTLLVVTRLLYNAGQSESDQSWYQPIIKQLSDMKNVSVAVVDGYHDVHNNEPEVVAPHISQFLVQEKSSL